ncbi:MAG: hypothetical protein Q7S28_01435 [bacterium]|nr:hypothetical protein [bacterium]
MDEHKKHLNNGEGAPKEDMDNPWRWGTSSRGKKFHYVFWAIGTAIVLLLTFKAGAFIGFKKASFSYRMGEKYYRGVMGPERGMFGAMGDRNFRSAHGVAGSIILVGSSTIEIQARDGGEQTVLITPQTAIRRFRETISAGDLKAGDTIIIIGAPNDEGEIEAKLIRVLPPMPAGVFDYHRGSITDRS